jgi:hypothetical protein
MSLERDPEVPQFYIAAESRAHLQMFDRAPPASHFFSAIDARIAGHE